MMDRLVRIIREHYQTERSLKRWQWQILGALIFGVGVVGASFFGVSSLIKYLYAADTISASWEFGSSGDYSLSDANKIEISDNTARLAVLNYATDSATKLLLHMDESSGEATDSAVPANTTEGVNLSFGSGKLNNAAIMDGSSTVIRVDDSAMISLGSNQTLEAWTKLDTNLSSSSHDTRQGIMDKGDYRLYYDNTSGKVVYELVNSSSNSWSQQAGNDIKGSWDLNGKTYVMASVADGDGNIYAGLGAAVADAEVWKWNGTTWSQIGGDGENSSWSDQQFETVRSLAVVGDYLYAGLGDTAGDAEVWRCSISAGCSSWSKIGGDGINSGWAVSTYEYVSSMVGYNGELYAGLGASSNDAEVWKWSGSTWSKIGGDSVNSGWTSGFETVWSMIADGSYLYAGLGASAGDAEVWRYNGSSWTRVGGDAINSSWANSTYEYVMSLAFYNGSLVAGLGSSANDAEVWSCSNCGTSPSWSQIGGDSLNSGWTTNYEGVYSLVADDTYLYAGLGSSNGDGEVWRWNGSVWSKIGGDGVNSSWITADGDMIYSLIIVDGALSVGVSNTAGNASWWDWSGSAWSIGGGGGINGSWGFYNLQSVEVLLESGGYLYAGTGVTVAGNAMVWRFDGSSWSLIGGQGINSSWGYGTYESVLSMAHYQGNLYVGVGVSANDAEVWMWNGTSWSKIGGDSLNSGWTTNYEGVYSLAVYAGNLYAGLGASNGDGEVWQWNGSSWTKVGGDSLNSGWTTGFNGVYTMGVLGGKLYAGLGGSAGEAEVWEYNGSVWSKVGGDGVNSSWNTVYDRVNALAIHDGELYAGLGITAGEAEVWRYRSGSWSLVGGDDIGSSWTDGTYEEVKTLTSYNGNLYVGLGTTNGDGEVWQMAEGVWSQIGGDGLNGGWDPNVINYVGAFSTYQGRLYAGTGNGGNADAAIWSWGNNGYLSSSTNSFDNTWRHVAATYDGATMKIYLDGVLDASGSATISVPDSGRDLLIGSTYGSTEMGSAQGYFDGMIDEVRLSNSARSSFQTTAYTTSVTTVQNAAAAFTLGIAGFESFVATESASGGSISYRLSDDGGDNWKYYNSGWVSSSSTSEANDQATINSNIASFPVGAGGIVWQAILQGNGEQRVTLEGVVIGAEEDLDDPTPPTTLTSLSSSGGSSISSGNWYAHSAPYFSWTGASDGDGSGLMGYYVYFGTNASANPETAGVFQAGSNYTASSLSSGQTYYLRIASRDIANNVSTVWEAFTYKYDATAPANPGALVVAPAGYTQSNNYTFTWTAGSDTASGLAGYQYKTATASGSLSNWSSTTTDTSVVLAGAAYQTDANIFYLRAIDNAGNVSGEMSINYYFAGDGPSAPQFLQATPASNTDNSFAFSWQAPDLHSGDESDLTYCYSVNTLPSVNTCSFTSPGATSLSASAFATQVGLNTFYLVAKNPADLGGAIAYSNYASVTFTANTSAPGIPLNIDVADISIKSSANWRLTVSWAQPSDEGSGVSNYKIYRSTDSVTYTEIASTTGTAYVDTGLSQVEYYYKVKACDSVSNCGAETAAVSLLPTGKYTEPASLSSGPSVTDITTKKATISWVTDRESDSRVQYGLGSGSYYDEEPSNSEQTTAHEISLSNLSPGTTYFYRTKWTDEDGNIGVSEEQSFTTAAAPSVKDVSAKNVGLTTATLSLTATGASKVRIYYGISTAFGGVSEQITSTSESSYDVEYSAHQSTAFRP